MWWLFAMGCSAMPPDLAVLSHTFSVTGSQEPTPTFLGSVACYQVQATEAQTASVCVYSYRTVMENIRTSGEVDVSGALSFLRGARLYVIRSQDQAYADRVYQMLIAVDAE